MGRGKEGREDAVPSAKCSLNREKRTIVGKEGVKKKKKIPLWISFSPASPSLTCRPVFV